MDIFNKQGLLPYLVSSLKTDIYPTNVAIPAGMILLLFSVNNVQRKDHTFIVTEELIVTIGRGIIKTC